MQSVHQNTNKALKEFAKRFVRIPTEKGFPLFRDLVTGNESGDSGILMHYYKKLGGTSIQIDALKEALPYAYDVVFIPNQDALIKNDIGDDVLNLWLPPLINYSDVIVTDRDVPLFIEYLQRLLPSDEERRFFTWWLAHIIRRPEHRIIATPLLRSESRTGKGFLVEAILQGILGKYSVGVCRPKDVFGSFNDIISGKIVLLIDEAQSIKGEALQELKSLVGNSNMILRLKGKGISNVENHSNVILASNFDDPIHIEHNDERLWIPEFIRHKVSPEETNSFLNKRLKPWLMNGGLQHVRDYLEQIDLDMYSATANAPMTQSKKELLKAETESKWESIVVDLVEKNQAVTQDFIREKLLTYGVDISKKKLSPYLVDDLGCVLKKVNNGSMKIYLTPSGQSSGLGPTVLMRQLLDNKGHMDGLRDG